MSVARPQPEPAPPRRGAPAGRQPATAAGREGTADPLKVIVSGYPPYTRIEDLKYVFATFGDINVKLLKRHAVITFPNSQGAIDALALSKKIIVYGSFLTVKPFREQTPRDQARPAFVRSKEKSAIIEPTQISLSGDFFQQLEQLLDAVRLTQEEVARISTLYLDVERALSTLWPGCRAVPFGSITTGLGVRSSDADCFVRLPPAPRQPDANYVGRAKRALQQFPDVFAEVFAIPHAHTPIVKFFHVPTATDCDVSFKTLLGSRNSRLVAFLLHLDARLVPAAVAVKYWAKVHGLTGCGRLSNYALTMLLVFYLQRAAVLPSVARLQRGCEELVVDDWNTAFDEDRQALPITENASSVLELYGGFFEFYANFNFEQLVVCPLIGHAIRKSAFADVDALPQEMDRYKQNVTNNLVRPMRFTTPICIQDPLELCHNVGSSVGHKLSAEMVAYFKFAAAAYQKDESTGCRDFLKTILLQKPVIPNRTANSVIRTTVHTKQFDKIVVDDWKKIFRNVITILFEEICLTKLEKLSADVRPDAKKQVERYAFTLTRAVWKRKRFNKLYDHMEGGFLEKQIRISNDIINTDKETFVLKMELGVCFLQDSRTVSVDIKYVEGEKSLFHEFGKMFLVMVKGWVFVLMEPFLTPTQLDTPNADDVDAASDEPTSSSDDINDSVDSNLNSETELSMSIKQSCTISDAPDEL